LEVDEAANAISGQVDPEANIIFGAAFDPALEGVVRVSVVATGMDGASIAAIEPNLEPAYVPQPAMEMDREPANAPVGFEPVMAAASAAPAQAATAQAGFSFDDSVVTLQPAARSVPAEEEPLFPATRFGDDRRQKGGWLSLFGGRRAEATAAAPGRTMTQAQPAPEVYEEEEDAVDEDLEIPSFLRRLAN